MSRSFTWGLLFGLATVVACSTGDEEAMLDEAAYAAKLAALNACQLNDGTVEIEADLRACDPNNKKKTTICHVPPGNPANAHTICIGNAAVKAHLAHHDDYLGPCKKEVMCPVPPPVTPPPPPSGSGGAGGSTPPLGIGGAGGSGAGGSAGSGSGGMAGCGAGGSGGSSVPEQIVD
ncbi:MAG TPA: hypothetical protein VGF45_16125 [Polyangia bacterium]